MRKPFTLASVFLMVALWFVSSRPVPHVDIGFTFMDKVIHFAVFGSLGILCYLGARELRMPHPLFYGALIASIYGVIDEIHQYFVPQRQCDHLDFVADMLGVVVLISVFEIIRRRIWKKQQS